MKEVSTNILALACLLLSGCAPSTKIWPDPFGTETNEEQRFVEYGGAIRQFCTARHTGSLCVTIVDSSTGSPITNPGWISAGDSRTETRFDSLGSYTFTIVPRDSIFIKALGFQRRKFIVSGRGIDSVVVPLSARSFTIWF